MNFDYSWSVAEADNNGFPLLIRFREFPITFPKARFPKRVNVFWRMSQSDKNGLPTDEEFKRLSTFEDRLVEAVESDQHSVLAAVLTCRGEKEFIFYTADVSAFLSRLTDMPQERERYPITIQSYDDPDWSYFTSVTSEH